jgi:hypothetical protein
MKKSEKRAGDGGGGPFQRTQRAPPIGGVLRDDGGGGVGDGGGCEPCGTVFSRTRHNQRGTPNATASMLSTCMMALHVLSSLEVAMGIHDEGTDPPSSSKFDNEPSNCRTTLPFGVSEETRRRASTQSQNKNVGLGVGTPAIRQGYKGDPASGTTMSVSSTTTTHGTPFNRNHHSPRAISAER